MIEQVHLVRYPDGLPTPDDFALVQSADPSVSDGNVLVEVSHLSMDPFPRLRMSATSRVGPPMPLHQVVDGRGVGHVLASRDPRFALGDLVAGDLGWQERVSCRGETLQKLDATLGPPERHLSVLGPSGLTAYFTTRGIYAGQNVLIAPAAGSVGILAGQIAKAAGAHVTGFVADTAQVNYLTDDLGFDGATDDTQQLPDGLDYVIDGVGGAFHDAMLTRLNLHSHVVLLGFISGYNDAQPRPYGSMLPLLFKRATVSGFLLADHAPEFEAARSHLAEFLDAGTLRPVETIWRGLEETPSAFCALFNGSGVGKQIVAIEKEQV